MLDAISIDNCRLLIQTLGHSLWQASVVAVLCWLVLRSLPARKAGTRYAVTCGGLVVVVLATLMTAAAVSTSVTTSTDIESAGASRRNGSTGNSSQPLSEQNSVTPARPSDGPAQTEAAPSDHFAVSHAAKAGATDSETGNLRRVSTTSQLATQSQLAWPALAAGVWLVGVLAMLFRLVRTIVALRRLEPYTTLADDTILSQVRDVISDLSRRMNLRWPVSLVVSDKMSVPGLIGTFWPTLLMPPAMLTGVPIEQLRIVIAHELAHAKRFDFLVNLGQLLVESFLFFNPAVWWLSRQIRIEREACCDAAAVAATGSAVPVARTLLDIVDRLTESLGTGAAGEFAMAAGVQSFVGDEPPESTTPLFDRVRRIVTPDQRPHVRVPWYTLMGVVLAYAFVSFGLYEGADATVQLVQQTLSPKERVEKIEELIASKGDLAKSEGVPVYSSDDPEPGSLFPKPATVSGIVRTSDGSPLPVPLTVYGTFSGPGIEATEGFASLNEPASEFRFSGKTLGQKYVRGDTATLGLYIGFRRDMESAGRFAPVAVGPFTIRSGQVVEDLELVLEPGFEGQLRVVDLSGNPIENAFVSGMFHLNNARSYARLGESRSETSPDGTTTIPACTSKLTWTTDIRAPGFQKELFDLKLLPDKISTVKLKPARSTTIRIVSGADSKPVSGAFAFNTLDQGSHDGRGYNRQYNDPRKENSEEYKSKYTRLYRYGPSDSHGMLKLDSLMDGNVYEFLIMAPGYGPTFVKDIKAGAELVDLTLHPELSVSGQIIGDLSTLRTRWQSKQKHIRYRNLNRNVIFDADVEERNGTGYFDIKHLGRGDLWLQLPDRTIAREMTESISDLVIDLNEPGSHDHRSSSLVTSDDRPDRILRDPTRKVVLTLTGADPSIVLDGQIRAGFIPRDRSGGSYRPVNYEVNNRQVEFYVEVPTKIYWSGEDFTGYSIVKESAIEVDVSEEPFRADVRLLPAGAVRGEVRLSDGSLSRRFQAYAIPVERIEAFYHKEVRIDGNDTPGEFLLTGLPLGHEFQTLVIDERSGSVASILTKPFRLDDGSPVADMKFQFEQGRTHVIQLEDEAGQPAIGAKVVGWFKPGLGFNRSVGWGVNEEGQVVFQHVSDSIPGETTFQIKAAGPFRGQKLQLNWSALPDKVVVKRGVSAAGKLVDATTGRGVAGASFFLFPSPSKAAEFRDAVWGETDDDGRFSFECLEAINYQLNISGAVSPRVPFRKNKRGILEPDFSDISNGSFPEWHLRGGTKDPAEIKVKLTPHSRLKLAPVSTDEG